ncbi:MAG: multiheme c-type cytochrome [SAR324 cluster bacterium]|nr:multiheme c-type cytochrome [SAR324 cluster bacterium]
MNNIPGDASPPARRHRQGRPSLVGLLTACALALLLSPATAPAASTAQPLLLAAGDLRGEIKPCGCSPEGQQGGLPRRLSYLASHLANDPQDLEQAPLLLDLGNNFPPPSAQGKLKIRLIQNLLLRFPPQAILPGPNELALGVEALDNRLPYLLSNEETGKDFTRERTVTRGGRRIGIFGYLSPTLVYQGSQQRLRLLPLSAALLERWRERQRLLAHDLAVLLFRGNDQELATLLSSGLFRHIIAGNPHSDEMNQIVERVVAAKRVPQVPTKGQGFLRLALDGGAATVDWLTDAWPDHADARQPFAAYDEAVKALFFARLETMEKRKAESPYLGAQACLACHAKPHQLWRASRHANAVQTLERVGKAFDPECLACHVAGLNSGGFLSMGLTPHLAGVQCENCHGPARAHALNPKANRPGLDPRRGAGRSARSGESVCRSCHVGSHSPNFVFERYWPIIRH